MTILFRLASHPLRWMLALLVAAPTAFALYQIVRPQSMVDTYSQRIYDAMEQLQRLAATYGVTTPYTSRPALDWGLIILLLVSSFTVYATLLQRWRLLPFICILCIPVFEAMRYYRPPVIYTAETAWSWWALQLLMAPLLVGFFAITVSWRIFVYSRMLWRIGWRWTAGLAIAALVGVAAARFFTPLRLIYDIETSAHPGSVWLVTLMLVWGGLAWLTWKLRRKSPPQPAPLPRVDENRLTFDEAYERVRAKRG